MESGFAKIYFTIQSESSENSISKEAKKGII